MSAFAKWPLPALLGLVLWAPALAQETIDRTTCADCHEEAETFATGPHGRAMARRSQEMLDSSCVACHGPAEEHIEEPLATNITRWPTDEACLECHQGQSGGLFVMTRAHLRHDVACLDCHDAGHQDPGTDALLATASPELCGGCHGIQAAAFNQPFAHRDGTQTFACLNCHSVHGTNLTGRLNLLGNGGACVECHSEKAGPFIFPHPPREIGNGCVACHEPHGSANPRLLTRRQILNLCLECHTNVPAFHDISQARFRNCQACHVAVHGSNRDPRLLDE